MATAREICFLVDRGSAEVEEIHDAPMTTNETINKERDIILMLPRVVLSTGFAHLTRPMRYFVAYGRFVTRLLQESFFAAHHNEASPRPVSRAGTAASYQSQ